MTFSFKTIFSKTLLTIFIATTLLSPSLFAKELTQQERNEMAAKLIPIITMLLMDDGDRVVPVLTLQGDSNITIELDSKYLEYGATAVDNTDGNITHKITNVSDVNTSQVGVYTVTYTVIDNAGNKSEITRTVNVIKSITLQDEDNTVVFESNSTQILERYVVDENSSELNISSKVIVVSSAVSQQMDADTKVIVIASDDKFPLGYTGKIVGSTTREDGSVELEVEDATLADVSHIELPQTTYDLKKMNFVGVISPFSETSPQASQGLTRGLQRGVIYEDDFDVHFDGEKINLQSKDESKIKIKLKDNLDLELLGSISNLKLTSKGEFLVETALTEGKIVKVDFSEDLRLTYDANFELALRGKYKGTLGYFDKYWKELEEIAFDKYGIALKGLNSSDKEGKIPIAGLVYNGALVGSTNIDSAFTASKAGGIIVWIYADMKGQLDLDGAIGIASHTHNELRFQKEMEQTIPYVSSTITAQPNKRYLEAPFIEGKVGVTLTKGLSVEVDVIVAGLRIINIAGEVKGELTETLETQSKLDGDATTNRLSYGLDTPDGIWKWSDGLICSKGSFGAGFVLNANFAMGISYKDTFERDIILNFQYPKQSDIDDENIKEGRIGTWYKFASHKECLQVPNPGTLNANHVANVRVAIDESALPQVADDNYLYAYLSNRIYDDTGTDLNVEKDGWVLVNIDDGNTNGFKAGLYHSTDGTNRYVIAYGGTTATSSDTWIGKTYDGVIDVVTDISLLSVVSTMQPSDALAFYDSSLTKVGSSGGNLEAITGHSLGGGLAQYAGLYGDVKTVTFNTAPLPFNMVGSLAKFQDKISITNAEGLMKSVHFNHEDKITNIMLPYDPVSTISTAIMSLDESNVGYMMAARFLLGIPANQKMDYLITGEKIYLPVADLNGFSNFSNHSMTTMKEVLENNTSYTLSFDLVQVANDINVTNQQVSGAMQSLMPSRYRWEAYSDGELISSGEGLDSISDLEAGTYNIKIYALLANALWVSSEKEIVVEAVDSVDLNAGLVAHYEFEGNADDSSGNGNHGTPYGGVGYVDGVIGQAGSFDGVDDYIDTEVNSDLSMSSLTLSTWIKIEGRGTVNPRIIGVGVNEGSAQYYAMVLQNDYSKYLFFTGDTQQYAYSEVLYSVPQSWKHISMNFDSQSKKVKIYIDGSLDSESIFTTSITSFTSSYLKIATSSNSLDRFHGKIDDLRIYNRALNEAEIQELYEMGSVEDNATSINHNGTTYGTVTSPHTGRIWLDRNLGASQVCTSFDDSACYGDYYQWGRGFDGHQSSASSRTTTKATNVNNAGNNFIIRNNDWASSDDSGATRSVNWSKNDGSSVCPIDYRVSTLTELKAETLDNGVTNRTTAFFNFLKLPSAGHRNNYNDDVIVDNKGFWGFVWASSTHGWFSHYITFGSNGGVAKADYYRRAFGFSVRCIKEKELQPLVANAGTNQTITMGEVLRLDGSQSVSNGDVIMDYVWSENGNNISSCHGHEICQNYSPYIGEHIIQLTVHDNNGNSASDTVKITILQDIVM